MNLRNKNALMFRRILCAFLCCFMLFSMLTPITVKGEEAELPYKILVNKTMNYVVVYEKNDAGKYKTPIRVMACSCGGDATPVGKYTTSDKYDWRVLVGNVWGRYTTRIVGSILFHSVPYEEKDESTLCAGEFNKLGSTASHGCVRLCVADAKWLFENCPVGTEVKIVDTEDESPLGEPEYIRITEGYPDNWDPTDIWDEKNPYCNAIPTIKFNKKMLTFKQTASSFDLKKGMKAVSVTGEDILDRVVAESDIMDEPGYYKVKYTLTDSMGRTTVRRRTVLVK